jgi:hypothetical protein
MFCSQFTEEAELAQQKETGSHSEHTKQTNGAILRIDDKAYVTY